MSDDRWGDGIPDELTGLDSELMNLRWSTPSPALRNRLLAAIERERNNVTSRRSSWAFAASAAAAALLWLNLSLSLVHNEGMNWSLPESPQQILATEAEIRSLAPELGPHAAGYAITLWSGTRLPRTANDWRGESHGEEFK